MATKKISNYYDDHDLDAPQHFGEQTEIILERREEVARVQLGDGPATAIQEAFRLAGEYISDKVGPGIDTNITIEFSLNGMNFIAKVES